MTLTLQNVHYITFIVCVQSLCGLHKILEAKFHYGINASRPLSLDALYCVHWEYFRVSVLKIFRTITDYLPVHCQATIFVTEKKLRKYVRKWVLYTF